MGQVIPKLYTVTIGARSDPAEHLFGSIQDAIDAADFGSTILLTGGDHSGFGLDPIHVKSGLRFLGLNKARIVSPIVLYERPNSKSNISEGSDIIFDSIIFKNKNNCSIEFANLKGLLFRNCEFQIDIKGIPISGCTPNARFGFHLSNSSALLQNPIFCINIEDIEVFIAIGADDNSTYLSLQSPIIRIEYKNVCKLETYFFRGVTHSSSVPYFEAFSSSIHYKTDSIRKHIYDGHCCLREKDRRQCGKRHCDRCDDYCNSRCKLAHECCEKKCKRNKTRPSNVRLFRGIDCVNTTINSTKIYFIEGKGSFNIAGGDSNIYVNGLSASTSNPHDWEVGDFNNLLLTSFMSNLKSACDIKECHCINDCSDDKDSRLPCPLPCPQTAPFQQQVPCHLPGPLPCPPGPLPCPPGPLPCPPGTMPCPPGPIPCPPRQCHCPPELCRCPPKQCHCPPGLCRCPPRQCHCPPGLCRCPQSCSQNNAPRHPNVMESGSRQMRCTESVPCGKMPCSHNQPHRWSNHGEEEESRGRKYESPEDSAYYY